MGPSQEQLKEPDFNEELRRAQATGDFDFVLETAKQSSLMLRDFRAAILNAKFLGRESGSIAMGVNFLDKMIQQSSAQFDVLKRAEKETREALKQAAAANGGPEKPAEPTEAPSA
jgi:hypothetical protein